MRAPLAAMISGIRNDTPISMSSPRDSIYTLIYTTVTPIPAYVYIGIWVAFQVLYAVLYTTAGVSGGVAWFAHLGGFAAGLALALVWQRRRGALAARG